MIKSIKNNAIYDHIYNKLNKLSNNYSINVVGVDGPTAAGKTIFADYLSKAYFDRFNKKCFIYRLDWTLEERNLRLKDLEVIKSNGQPFRLEAELHMRLKELESFLVQVQKYNELVSLGSKTSKNLEVNLKNLYSRESGGNLSGEFFASIPDGSIIIVEGHYSLRSELHKYFNLNILLLSDQETLLKRKIARVADYRGSEEAEFYFRMVDIPSFRYHLERYRYNATEIIQNNDYLNPYIATQSSIDDWLRNCNDYGLSLKSRSKIISNKLKLALTNFFSESIFIPTTYRIISENIFNSIHLLDAEISRRLTSSVDEQAISLSETIEDFVDTLNLNNVEHDEQVELMYTNALHNVYFRTYPISIGIGLKNNNNLTVLVDFYEEKIAVYIAWKGGVLDVECQRALGQNAINHKYEWATKESVIVDDLMSRPILLTPTRFTFPSFIDPNDFVVKIVGKDQDNISASECLRIFRISNNICWVFRFSLQGDAALFRDLSILCGGNAIIIGNYLIALRGEKYINRFIDFQKKWDSFQDNDVSDDIASYDSIIKNERCELEKIVGNNEYFKVLDTHIFLKITPSNENFSKFSDYIKIFLNSKNRLLRKRTTQFITRQFGAIELSAKRIWDEYLNTESTVSLSDIVLMQPTIMAEIYLWMTIKEMPSAILGANIYDISVKSLDVKGHLMAASFENVPIVLQASLNALGPEFGESRVGYLEPINGANDLVNAIMHSIRDLCVRNKLKPPLFGIGLDHIDSRNDRPMGRARKFLEDALETGLITHIVLDGSSLFNASDTSEKSLAKAYDLVSGFETNLVSGMERIILVDKEFCIGELNYIGSDKLANIPSALEINLFVQSLKKRFRKLGLGSFLRRPMLFIGNVGTTHHSGDVGIVKSEVAGSWVELVKKDLFISAVLHGTTGSKAEVLRNSLSGCKKVNIAGDFLSTYVKSMPLQIQNEIKKINAKEPKRALAKVRKSINNLSDSIKQTIIESIGEHSRRIIKNINSPLLDDSDQNFFRYSPYIFSVREIDEILRQIKLKVMQGAPSAGCELPRKISDFSASLIEIPFGPDFIKTTTNLYDLGIINYHIDVGDGDLISRKFSGLQKIKALKNIGSNIKISTHLMVRNPHAKIEETTLKNYIASYAEAGSDRIAIHLKSVPSDNEAKFCFQSIRELGCTPGIIIEVDEVFTKEIEKIIIEDNLEWLVVMGVPIGYGGQIFNNNVINKIATIRQFSNLNNRKLIIEIDGGLTLNNIRACRIAGANVFAGWSIIKPDEKLTIAEKITLLKKHF